MSTTQEKAEAPAEQGAVCPACNYFDRPTPGTTGTKPYVQRLEVLEIAKARAALATPPAVKQAAEPANPAVRTALERLKHVDREIWDDVERALQVATEDHLDPGLDELDCNLLLDLIWLYRNAPNTAQATLPEVPGTEREAFEAWRLSEVPGLDMSRNMPDGSYNNPGTHDKWQAWQARARLGQGGAHPL